jgi:hypothetical protein
MVPGYVAALSCKAVLVLALFLLRCVLILGQSECRGDLARTTCLLFCSSLSQAVQFARSEEGLELVRVDSNALPQPQNATRRNQARSDPCVNRVHTKSIPQRKFRDLQVHTRHPQSHQIMDLRQRPEKRFRFSSFCFVSLRVISRLLLVGNMRATILQ